MNRSILLLIVIAFSLVGLPGLQPALARIDIEVTQDTDVVVEATVGGGGESTSLNNYVYIVQVEDETGVVVFLEYIMGFFTSKAGVVPSIDWQPDSDGTYT